MYLNVLNANVLQCIVTLHQEFNKNELYST